MTRLGRFFTNLFVTALESVGIAPKGTKKVSQLLNNTADDIVSAGKAKIFTPSYFFLARKI